MINTNLPFILGRLLFLLPLLALTAGSALYLVRTRRVEGMVMLAGNLLSLLVSIANMVLAFMLIRHQQVTTHLYGQFSIILQLASLAGAVLFAGGFIMAALKAPRKA